MNDSAPYQSTWYKHTLVPPSRWKSMTQAKRRSIVNFFWVATFCPLVLGFQDPFFWKVAVGVNGAHAVIVLALVGFQPLVFPVQVRLAYGAWIGVGAWVDTSSAMVAIATVGLGANLSFDYCLLARILNLLPWNRRVPLTWNVLAQCLSQPPQSGRFQLKP